MLKKHRADQVAADVLLEAGAGRAGGPRGVPRVHIIDGRVEEGLLAEVFSNEGIGTLIHANEYQAIRRAQKKDVRAILRPDPGRRRERRAGAAHAGPRSSGRSTTSSSSRWTATRSPAPRCTSTPTSSKAELACVCVDARYENQGIGGKLMQLRRGAGASRWRRELFCLSTQAFNYFQQKGGFHLGTPDDLPPARRERYEHSGRQSQVLVKKL